MGSAPWPPGLPYWPGWDIARAAAGAPHGGVYVLDGWGGIHPFGSAPSPKPIDWAPVDRWRGIVVTWGGYWGVRNDGTVEIG